MTKKVANERRVWGIYRYKFFLYFMIDCKIDAAPLIIPNVTIGKIFKVGILNSGGAIAEYCVFF